MSDTYAAEVDLTDLSLYERGVPHDVFAELRARGGVHHHRGHYGPNRKAIEFWSVVRHAEVQQANRDWQAFSAIDGPGIERTRSERRGTMIVAMDPPDHTRHLKLISAGFTPRMIGRLEERIRTWTDRILDAV